MKQPWLEVGLTQEEYGRIIHLIGREPNLLELNLYGVMWSEHCSYKNSCAMLKEFPLWRKGAPVRERMPVL